jgi:small-conductance mechanosensitive channel
MSRIAPFIVALVMTSLATLPVALPAMAVAVPQQTEPQESPGADSLQRLQQENDSLRAALGGTASTGLEVTSEAVQSIGLRSVLAVLVLVLTFFLIRGVGFVLESLAERNAHRRLFFKRLLPILRIAVWGFAIYVVLGVIFNLSTTNLITAAAAVGLAVGFAAQDILKNIFGGLVIVFDQPFQVGDKISVGGTYGEVVSIGLRSTRITTPDDNLVSVPNAQIVDGQVSNANAGALDCQVVTDLYLPGWVDETHAKQIAYDAAASSPYAYLEKPIVVIVKDEFKETFVTHLKVKAYVLDTRYEFLLASDITERARRAFREAGLLTPTHGARAYVDLTGLSHPNAGNGHAPRPASADDGEAAPPHSADAPS